MSAWEYIEMARACQYLYVNISNISIPYSRTDTVIIINLLQQDVANSRNDDKHALLMSITAYFIQ